MAFFCRYGDPSELVESNGSQTCEQVLELLRKLTIPGNTLITTLPSGLGLDFHLEGDQTLWVEFYADEISSAFVTTNVAEQIVRRAFDVEGNKVKVRYADLVAEWEY